MLNFSMNWNGKLDWKMFTTIRLWTADKLIYYKRVKNEEKPIPISINKKVYCHGYLFGIRVMPLNKIPEYIKQMDTGLSAEEFDKLMEKMYGKKDEWNQGNTLMIILIMVRT